MQRRAPHLFHKQRETHSSAQCLQPELIPGERLAVTGLAEQRPNRKDRANTFLPIPWKSGVSPPRLVAPLSHFPPPVPRDFCSARPLEGPQHSKCWLDKNWDCLERSRVRSLAPSHGPSVSTELISETCFGPVSVNVRPQPQRAGRWRFPLPVFGDPSCVFLHRGFGAHPVEELEFLPVLLNHLSGTLSVARKHPS